LGKVVAEGPMRTLVIALAVGLVGCATYYESSYWRHPITGITVECDFRWEDSVLAYGAASPFKDRCEQLMKRAGLVPITHDEGKAWEKTSTR
jgi:hypothetical protein